MSHCAKSMVYIKAQFLCRSRGVDNGNKSKHVWRPKASLTAVEKSLARDALLCFPLMYKQQLTAQNESSGENRAGL